MLSSTEIAALRAQLEARASALRGELSDKLGQARDDFDAIAEPGDAGDHSQAESTRDIDLAEADRDRAEFEQVQAALARLDDGSYGSCGDCGADIPSQRLQAQPLASRCIACQERAERNSAFQRSSL